MTTDDNLCDIVVKETELAEEFGGDKSSEAEYIPPATRIGRAIAKAISPHVETIDTACKITPAKGADSGGEEAPRDEFKEWDRRHPSVKYIVFIGVMAMDYYLMPRTAIAAATLGAVCGTIDGIACIYHSLNRKKERDTPNGENKSNA